MTTTPTPTPARRPAGRCGGCGTRHRVSPTSGYCPVCTWRVRVEAARHVVAHPGRRPAWPAPARRWGP
jgi:hypothetical protein